jgi:hypothetical protein
MTEKSSNPTRLLTLQNIRDIAVVALIFVVSWKFVNADIKIDISSFSFNDLLSLILAIFSVWLSVIFYFKANDGSNQFYDNTYRFTKEMSEILGRIEAGFGEKLRHLDDGYSGLREKFDRIPLHNGVTPADVKKEEDEIRQKESEQKALIESLAEKAKLDTKEKEQLFQKLAEQTAELDSARRELRRLRRVSAADTPQITIPRPRHPVLRYVATKMSSDSSEDLSSASLGEIIALFETIKSTLHPEAINDLIQSGHLDAESQTLNPRTASYIRAYIREQSGPE